MTTEIPTPDYKPVIANGVMTGLRRKFRVACGQTYKSVNPKDPTDINVGWEGSVPVWSAASDVWRDVSP